MEKVVNSLKVYLGLSLSTLLLRPGVDDLVIDIWEGGSYLYGWDLRGGICLDRLPLMVNDSQCISKLGAIPVKYDINITLLGSEKDAMKKLEISSFHEFWPLRFSSKAFLPENGWCALFRKLRNTLRGKQIFGELKYIDPVNKEIRVGWWDKIRYDVMYNSMPLDYILTKIRTSVSKKLTYFPLYIGSYVLKGNLEEIRIYILGKRKYASAVSVLIPFSIGEQNASFLQGKLIRAYLFIPYLKFKSQGAFREKALSDLKRLNFKEEDIIVERGYYEKYGILSAIESPPDLGDYKINLVGRLGTWRDKGICEIVNEFIS